MGRGRIRSGKGANKQGHIVTTALPSVSPTINFSFRHIDANHEKFRFSAQNSNYFCKVLERLKNLSTFTAQELITERSAALKCHPIDWRHTSEPDGFSHLHEQFQNYTPYQFSISRNEHGRIHGFFIGNVFHIVWLDPEHKLYPSR
ncbi:hypothetical protein HmCmsJML079_03969 [Escherichia coli]|nr:hypothetical protein HmCmsJML079_03969 [Escherichia coli]